MEQLPLDQPYLILVEGPSDAAFFKNLILTRNIKDVFCIRYPKQSAGVNGNGCSRYRQALDGFVLLEGFSDLKGILLVIDSDTDPNYQFSKLCDEIANTTHGHAPPASLATKSNGSPPIVIITIPWINTTGTLENLCLAAAEKAITNNEILECYNKFVKCVGVSNWAENKRAKAKLRTIIATTFKRNPDISLSYIWDDSPQTIPLNDCCFDQIAAFLKNFPNLIAS